MIDYILVGLLIAFIIFTVLFLVFLITLSTISGVMNLATRIARNLTTDESSDFGEQTA